MGRVDTDRTDDLKLFVYKLAGLKKGEEAHFKVQSKNEETDKYEDLDNEEFIEGKLTKIKVREYEWEGKPIRKGQLHLVDSKAGEFYIVEFGMNSVSRSIINSLAGATEPIERVKINLWNNKQGFPNASIKVNGLPTDWLYDWNDEIKPRIGLIDELDEDNNVVGQKKSYKKLDAWLLDEVFTVNIAKLISDKAEIVPPNGKPVASEAELSGKDTPVEIKGEDEDDLPF